jgi:hypothetical protein
LKKPNHEKNWLNWLEFKKNQLVRFGFSFISLKPKKQKPNRTEPKQKNRAKAEKTELNRKNRAKQKNKPNRKNWFLF